LRSTTDIIHSITARISHAYKAGNAHNIHAPYMYSLYTKVITEAGAYYCFEEIEKLRNTLLKTPVLTQVQDYGTGVNRTQKLSTLVKRAAKSSMEAQLLFRLVNYLQPTTVVELGTHVGISTCYMASACSATQLHTVEGSPQLAKVAGLNFKRLQLHNVTQHIANFDTALPQLIKVLKLIDIAYVDGNHAYAPTISYYNQLKHCCGIIVFDDIHWSIGMSKAWQEIVNDQSLVKITVDLYNFGLVIIRPETKHSQHYNLKF
jgi:predicted O-methyltransferase YrrM